MQGLGEDEQMNGWASEVSRARFPKMQGLGEDEQVNPCMYLFSTAAMFKLSKSRR